MTTAGGGCTVVYDDKAMEEFLQMFELVDVGDLTSCVSMPNSEVGSTMLYDADATLTQVVTDMTRENGTAVKLASDPDHGTPRIKKNGVFNQPVRRRLFFPDSDDFVEHSENGQRISHSHCISVPKANKTKSKSKKENDEFKSKRKGTKRVKAIGARSKKAMKAGSTRTISPVSKTTELSRSQKLPTSIEKVVPVATNRKIAQLVVWTKNCSKVEDSKQEDQGKYNTQQVVQLEQCSRSDSTASTVAPLKDFNQEGGDLFLVHYPVRPSYEVSKSKVKAVKRPRNPSPVSFPEPKKRKWLESKRQEDARLLDCEDFRVEKLFETEEGIVQSEQGTVEIQPVFEAALPVHESIVVSSELRPAETAINEKGEFKADQVSREEIPLDRNSDVEKNSTDSSSEAPDATADATVEQSNPANKATVEGALEHSEFPPFTLPDQFTVVTSDTPNEFDLLIQNVVHEELVDGNGENMGFELSAKKMKLNNDSSTGSKVSSQEGMTMDEAGKPRCTYTELIEKALTETGGLTVSEIYSWISERYPFYKPDDDRWKNSVRHNLSINPYFKKGEKARSGAGHLWTISEESKGLRPSMVSWEEVSSGSDRRKCPYDPSEFTMPMESETDRAVANILGRYVSECRAKQEALQNDGKESKEKAAKNDYDQHDQSEPNLTTNAADITHNTSDTSQNLINQQVEQQQQTEAEFNSSGAISEAVPTTVAPQFSINELNSGHFTVDLSGITIPEGGSINFEDLVNHGRLIYIQTDLEANKENESSQAIVLNESLIPELSDSASIPQNNDDRYQPFYPDSLGLDLGFGKGDSISHSFPPDDILAAACAHLISDDTQPQEHQQNLTNLDQVITLPNYGIPTTSSDNGNHDGSGLSENLSSMDTAALYESRELGISYTYQGETNEHDLLQ